MKIEEIVVSCSAKINNGNYESTDYFISIKATDIAPGDADKLRRTAETAILDTLVAQYKLKGISTTRQRIAKQHALANAL